ncbi:hypothetical protein HUW46_00292 [Amycolatopsis sp. CA-230715]|nr:hypothetical protein HUW46_00292 [Amycolatopsis sp. CA-230715]
MRSALALAGAVAAVAAGASVLAAAPAVAASAEAATLSIVSAVVAADDTVDVNVTYTCDSGYSGEILAYVNDVTASAFGGNEVAVTCDGASHSAVVAVGNDNEATEYVKGHTAAVGVALDATKTGSPDLNAAQDANLALG